MRYALMLIVAATFSLPGCTIVLKNAGKDLSKLKTRDDVRRDFGPPLEALQFDDRAVETYQTRRKISETWRYPMLAMGYVMTFGLGDLVWFPCEVVRFAKHTAVGQRLQFSYDATGRIVDITLDGERASMLGADLGVLPVQVDDK